MKVAGSWLYYCKRSPLLVLQAWEVSGTTMIEISGPGFRRCLIHPNTSESAYDSGLEERLIGHSASSYCTSKVDAGCQSTSWSSCLQPEPTVTDAVTLLSRYYRYQVSRYALYLGKITQNALLLTHSRGASEQTRSSLFLLQSTFYTGSHYVY